MKKKEEILTGPEKIWTLEKINEWLNKIDWKYIVDIEKDTITTEKKHEESEETKQINACLAFLYSWDQLDSMFKKFEEYLWCIIGKEGYPTKWKAFCKAFHNTSEKPSIIIFYFYKIIGIKTIRKLIKEKDYFSAHCIMTELLYDLFVKYLVYSLSQIEYSKKFKHGPKSPRHDNLSTAMIKAWREFVKEHKQDPKCFEVYDWITEGEGNIQEKDPDTQTIYWVDSQKIERTTTYNTFKNRFTKIKRELKSK